MSFKNGIMKRYVNEPLGDKGQLTNKNIKLTEFLQVSRRVTENYIKAWGNKKWSTTDQWKKIDEEDEEFRNAIDRQNELEEFWDCFFARLTLLHIEGFWDDDIFQSGIDKWNIINQRSLKALATVQEKRNE